jgi:hypothetical protein
MEEDVQTIGDRLSGGLRGGAQRHRHAITRRPQSLAALDETIRLVENDEEPFALIGCTCRVQDISQEAPRPPTTVSRANNCR